MQIKTGHVLIRTSARLPKHMGLSGTLLNQGWMLLSENVHSFDSKVRTADWHFFSITEEKRACAVARRMEDAVARALRRALRRIKGRYNAAEICEIQQWSIAGLSFCRVSVATRHVQYGPILALTESVGLFSPRPTSHEEPFFQEDELRTVAA